MKGDLFVQKKLCEFCMAIACIASHPGIQMLLDSNGIKIYVAQRKVAVAAYKSNNELHPA